MRYCVKVFDLVGVGYTRGYWTRRGAERAAAQLSPEFAPAVRILTAREMAQEDTR